jgi:hypothetical protein
MAPPKPAKAPVINHRHVRRRARRGGKKAGRAAARGRPHAPTLDDLPARIWVKEYFEDHIEKVKNHLQDQKSHRSEELSTAERQKANLSERLEAAKGRELELSAARAEDKAEKPHVQQDQHLVVELGRVQQEVRDLAEQVHEIDVEIGKLDERIKAIDERMVRQPRQELEACDVALKEHDTAYEQAQHSSVQNLLGRLLPGRPEFSDVSGVTMHGKRPQMRHDPSTPGQDSVSTTKLEQKQD